LEKPFWERYPSQYLEKGGASTFSVDAWVDENHDTKLNQNYFPIVAMMKRNPRYTNKRIMDPQLKCFVDEQGYVIPPEWGLPTPNADASYDSLAKYAKDIKPMSEDMVKAMNKAWEYTNKHFGVYMCDSRVISYEEARAHFDMSTSSGAPFNVHYPMKSELFEKDLEIDAWLQQDWETMATDPYWTCLFTNSLKEELRTTEKMNANSIRTFLSGGIDAVAHGTRLFVDMNEKLYDSHLLTASAVGMSPLKGNWDKLYQKLRIFRKGYALDESQYDSSLRVYLMWGCAKMRWNMLRDEDRTPDNLQRIKIYYRNLVNTLVVCPDGVLVLKKTGNPSGSVNTIADNTLILYTLMAYAWIMNVPEDLNSYTNFELHTSKALVGDDNTWTVSDEMHSLFNARSVIETWKNIGVTTTTDSLEPRKPEELDFLSAHTIFMGGMAVPIYDRTKLMTSLLYAPEKHITPATTLERTAAMLSVGWTDVQFRRFCREVIDWLLVKYDHVLFDDPRWIMAKCQIKTDEDYFKLFTGTRMLRPQSISGARVKLIQPDKSAMSALVPKGQGRNPARKQNQNRRVRRRRAVGLQTQTTPAVVVTRVKRVRRSRNLVAAQQKPRRRRNQTLTGRGVTRTPLRGKRTCTIQEDEFIAAVVGSTGFSNVAYAINPGQATTFPWLSKQAAQWEKYHFDRLEFYYKRDVSEFATNGTTGKVIMSVDFDASDAPPSTKQQIEDTDPRVDGMPCENLALPLNARDMHSLYPTLYVRPGGLPGASDIKTYDAGNFNIATQGCQNTSEIGELRVRYTVTFSVPVLESATAVPANNSVALLQDAAGQAVVTNVTTNAAVATATFNGIQAVNTAGSIVLPAGNYLVDASTEFTAAGAGVFSVVAVGFYKNAVLINQVNSINLNIAAVATILTVAPMQLMFQSNGTDTLSLGNFATFAAGTATTISSIRIVAI